jgi:hypothetical protein
MKKRIFILWISIMIFLGGCSGTQIFQSPTPAGDATHTLQGSPPSTNTQREIPSSTPTIVLPSTSVTPVETPTLEIGVVQNCLTIQSSLPRVNGYSGKIAFETHLPGNKNSLGLYDPKTGEFSEIPGGNSYLSISPNRGMYAYYDYDAKSLKVFSSDGKQIKSFPWDKNWGNIDHWLNNQNIVILMTEPESPGSNFEKYPPATLIFNINTNGIQILQPDYPGIDKVSTFPPWGYSGSTVYDPTLTRVVYPGITDAKDVKYGFPIGGYILYGIPEKKILAQIQASNWFGHPPVWTTDGSKFIMMGDGEFYLVNSNGETSKITNMNPELNLDKATGYSYLVDLYSWSPDGQHVALWLQKFGTDHRTVAILDTQSGLITDTCLLAGYNPNHLPTSPYPVWSPDGRSLVVAANYRPEDNGNDVVLVNLEKNEAYKLTTNKFPVGWLITP